MCCTELRVLLQFLNEPFCYCFWTERCTIGKQNFFPFCCFSGNQAINQSRRPLRTMQELSGSPLEPDCCGRLLLNWMQNWFHTFRLFHGERQIDDDSGFGLCWRRLYWSLFHCHPPINTAVCVCLSQFICMYNVCAYVSGRVSVWVKTQGVL